MMSGSSPKWNILFAKFAAIVMNFLIHVGHQAKGRARIEFAHGLNPRHDRMSSDSLPTRSAARPVRQLGEAGGVGRFGEPARWGPVRTIIRSSSAALGADEPGCWQTHGSIAMVLIHATERDPAGRDGFVV